MTFNLTTYNCAGSSVPMLFEHTTLSAFLMSWLIVHDAATADRISLNFTYLLKAELTLVLLNPDLFFLKTL